MSRPSQLPRLAAEAQQQLHARQAVGRVRESCAAHALGGWVNAVDAIRKGTPEDLPPSVVAAQVAVAAMLDDLRMQDVWVQQKSRVWEDR